MFTLDRIFKDKEPEAEVAGHIRQNWTDISPEALGSKITQDYYYFSATCYYTGLRIFKGNRVWCHLILGPNRFNIN